ncbi:ribose-phosphate pyrophosphokinase [Fusibacter paucivorans]|uniref:ribose-phosphate diphosphokinase n=1 Tax=Fusibacter paucivorans TaxID=76009 RepID=A0ABS5PMC0_9FIRM|nr:ribose-phosphate pyrophosphokinase [Fusibacter paucivorans]MBS7526047.1 ribose-phosphate pyrophosphokinase [Fusibacter paucivorans]
MEDINFKQHIPFGDPGLIVMENCKYFGDSIDRYLLDERLRCGLDAEALPETYIIKHDEVRFSNGEGKVFIEETVRGKDIYILTDIGNYSLTYKMHGFINHKSPDDHLQDLKRVLSAMAGKARRITLIMPLLYASRQHSRKGRESLDCAMALQELEKLGIDDIITFDAHDPTIQNAIPLISFENLYPTFEIVKSILCHEKAVLDDPSNMLIVSPDTGAMDRAIYYSSVLSIDIGLFYKRRDHSRVVHGRNPIVQHEYIGQDVTGKNILIVDDMIASGESVFDIAKELKKRKAGKIFIATTFALFTDGISKFTKFYDDGLIDRVYTTNLSYLQDDAKKAPWLTIVDMSEYIAKMINRLNFDISIGDLIDASVGIRDILAFKNDLETEKDA